MIDLEACENTKGFVKTALVYKYYYRINHYGGRDRDINRGIMSVEYPRYSGIEI